MNIVAIVQARLGSSRLPRKVFKEINGEPIIKILLNRLEKAKYINKIVVATTENEEDNELEKYINHIGFDCIKGDRNNVLNRYCKAALRYKADIIVRVTGDCPLVDSSIVDKLILEFKDKNIDYISNRMPPTFPDGLDVEVFTIKSLLFASNNATSLYDKEHVTPFLINSKKITIGNIANPIDYSHLRWTVDELADFLVVEKIFKHFYPKKDFSWTEVIKLYERDPKIFNNNYIERDEGAGMGKGQKLWRRAKAIIPGGNMLLSKRSEMFLPNKWPSYYSKAKGCEVWDLDGNSFIDMSIMGIGTNILGFANNEVDTAVVQSLHNSNMSTFNCPEEVYLTEKLLEMHSWADMGRLARAGGEANAIAIRIARAASNKDNIAVCGYHGWHDWYLSANLSKDKLSGHLLPGLEPKGVPKNLSETVFPFKYNDYKELEELVSTKNIGIIKMEVIRNEPPQNNFLKKVRELATKNNIILIFDECTSGFRESFGGIHKVYDVKPDMAMFGKALGNGYPITAVIGKRDIMEEAQSTFISSTFWTERIGPTAALKTLEIMSRDKTWEYITNLGLYIREKLQSLSKKYEIKMTILGIPALTSFVIDSDNSLKYKTFITQEMLKKGYLSSNCIYVSVCHTKKIIDNYFEHLDPIFKIIKECEEGQNIDKLLDGPVCHQTFNRLN